MSFTFGGNTHYDPQAIVLNERGKSWWVAPLTVTIRAKRSQWKDVRCVVGLGVSGFNCSDSLRMGRATLGTAACLLTGSPGSPTHEMAVCSPGKPNMNQLQRMGLGNRLSKGLGNPASRPSSCHFRCSNTTTGGSRQRAPRGKISQKPERRRPLPCGATPARSSVRQKKSGCWEVCRSGTTRWTRYGLAATTPKSPSIQGVAKSRLWLYGGTTHPYNRYETV
jgi:hypothetical protein